MGILNKMMFWKHDDLELPKFNTNPNYDGYSPDRTGVQQGISSRDNTLGLSKDPLQMNDPLGNYPKTGIDNIDNTSPDDYGTNITEQPLNSSQSNFNKFRQTGLGQTETSSDPTALSKNIEILTAKIETIKSMLDYLGHKIDKIEKIAEGEQQKPATRRYQW